MDMIFPLISFVLLVFVYNARIFIPLLACVVLLLYDLNIKKNNGQKIKMLESAQNLKIPYSEINIELLILLFWWSINDE